MSIATRKSQTRSISPRRWLATITAIPNSAPVRLTSESISSRPSGSRPLVGSSSSSSRGSVDERLGELDPLLHAGRIATDRAIALLVQPDVAQHLGGAFAGRRRGQPRHARHVADEIGRESRPAAGSPTRACSRRTGGSWCRRPRTSMPMTSALPEVGSSSPRRILSSVLLPAPLAPTSPMIPGSSSRLSPVERRDRRLDSAWSGRAGRGAASAQA